MKNPKSPEYGILSNIQYMISLAVKICKSVLLLAAIQVILGVLLNLLELFIAPAILRAIEEAASLSGLLAIIAFFSLGIIFTGTAADYINMNTLFGRVSIRTHIISDLHEKFCRTSYPNTEDPDFLKRYQQAYSSTQGNDGATEAIWNTLVDLLKNGISFLFYLLLITSLNPFILGITLVTSVLGYYLGKPINEWGYRHREEESEYREKISYVIRKSMEVHLAKDIRIFQMQNWLNNQFFQALKKYQCWHNKAEKIYFGADALDTFLSFLRNGIAYGYLIYLVAGGQLSASAFLLYFSAITGFTAWISGILENLAILRKQSQKISLVREFVGSKERFLFEEGKPLFFNKEEDYTIELRDVSFRYPHTEEDTLKHINLTIHKGEKLAVVGLNGAGKTTLIKLICGFYDPTEGSVLLNGEDIRKYNRRDYYKCFAAVYQNLFLLAGNIAENVAQTDVGIDMAKVKTCIEKAGLTEKIESLPQGYDSKLEKRVYEDAVELSGGELQRLILARALYKESTFIILDEPTAALDPIAENEIYRKYNDLTQGCTSVFISHRLASTRFCDRILFIENGRLAEEGTHEALTAKGGLYAKLFEVQSRYYKEKEGYTHETAGK